ncbi:MAG: hypothetical protein QMD06_01590, partial [Candidatus Altarchaeum sp.]|nr:hypothetical protein [Candidatus Altarchaeum sp.]
MINLRATLLEIIFFYIFINIVFALPDLVAEIEYYPKNASVGDIVTLIGTVKNIGNVNLERVTIGIFFGKGGGFTWYNISANS